MALAFFEKELHNVHRQLRGFGQRDTIGRRRAWGRLPDP